MASPSRERAILERARRDAVRIAGRDEAAIRALVARGLLCRAPYWPDDPHVVITLEGRAFLRGPADA